MQVMRSLHAFGFVVLVAVAILLTSVVSEQRAAAQDDAGVHQPAVDALRLHLESIFDGTGCSEGAGLCPGEPLQRWEMAVWLVRVIDRTEPEEPASSRFADVDDAEWWLAHVERLAELEVTKGCAREPLKYCPDAPVTRAQMASFLVRAFDLQAADSVGFVDTRGSVHEANIDALAAVRVTIGCRADPPRTALDST